MAVVVIISVYKNALMFVLDIGEHIRVVKKFMSKVVLYIKINIEVIVLLTSSSQVTMTI